MSLFSSAMRWITGSVPLRVGGLVTYVCLAALLGLGSFAVSAGADEAEKGAVVTEVRPHDSAAAAGLQVGDRLLSWRRAPSADSGHEAAGVLRSALDFWEVELEQHPHGLLEFDVDRAGERFTVTLPTSEWGLTVDNGERLTRLLDPATSLEAEELSPLERGHIEERRALALFAEDRFQEATERHEAALALRREAAPKSLATAMSLDRLGICRWYLGERGVSRELWKEALALREAQAPGSLIVAKSLNNLALVVTLEERHDLSGRAMAIREQQDPKSSRTANLLANFGDLNRRLGNRATAERYLNRAVTMLEEVDPGSRRLATTLSALAAYTGCTTGP